MAKYDNEDGVWRTIGGRRVFIKTGQSLADAMKESGKFKKLKDIEHQQRKINNELAGLTGKDKEIADEEYDAYEELKKSNSGLTKREEDKKKNTIDKDDINALNELADSGKDINDYYGLDDIAKDYIKNRREEMGRNAFIEKSNAIHEKTKEKTIEAEKTTDEDKRYNTIEKKLESQHRYAESEAVKEVKDKYMPERTKAVADYQNGAIDRDELLKRFDGNEERMNQTFEQLGYKAPTKENIERANENARKRAEERKNKETSSSKTYKSKDLEQGKPYSIDYGNGIKKTAVFVGKDEDGNNMFYDGEGVDGRFAFSDRFLDESVKITDNKDDDKFIELHNQIKGNNKQKSAKEELEEMVNSRKKLGKDIDNYYKQSGTETGLAEKARQEIISGYDNYDDAISNFAEEHDIPRYRAEEYFEKARKKLGITTARLKGEEESGVSSAINDKIRERARRSQEKQKELQKKVASSGDDVAEEMRYADDRATFRKISKTYGYDNLSDNEIKEVLDFAEKRGLYHSKEEIATMRRYLDSRVLRNEFDTYKKEHPDSKMSFTEWKKNNKK